MTKLILILIYFRVGPDILVSNSFLYSLHLALRVEADETVYYIIIIQDDFLLHNIRFLYYTDQKILVEQPYKVGAYSSVEAGREYPKSNRLGPCVQRPL